MSDTLIFSQGQLALLTAQFVTTPAGMPIDVPDAQVALYGLGGSVILPPTNMINLLTGFYYLNYVVPNSLPIGVYTVRYTGTVLGIPTAATAQMQVLLAGTPPGFVMTQPVIDLIAALGTYLDCALHIPVYNELARRNKDFTQYQLRWPRWNLTNPEIRMNGDIIDTGFAIDYDIGRITFDTPRHETDKITGTYNFRFFSQIDMIRFLSDALSQINLEPPATDVTLSSELPQRFVGVLMMGAAKNAIMKMLMCLQFQDPSTIFGPPDRAKDAFSNLSALKENYEKQFTADKKTVKTKGPYPRMAIVSTPEYTLPGGRSRWFRYLFSSNVG